jgi:hypothetical protein
VHQQVTSAFREPSRRAGTPPYNRWNVNSIAHQFLEVSLLHSNFPERGGPLLALRCFCELYIG